MALSSRIWEGRDYLPRVFDAWLADGDGEFDAVLLDGRVVGCGKLTFFTPVDAWLEGLRKDPSVPEKGLGRALALHFFNAGSSPGARLGEVLHQHAQPCLDHHQRAAGVPEAHDPHAHELAGRQGGAGGCFPGEPAASASAPEVVTVRDESLVYDFLVRFGCFRDTAGLVVDGWQARPFSPELLAERYVRPGCCRGILSDEGLAGLVIARFDERVLRTPAEDRLSRCAGHCCRRRTVR